MRVPVWYELILEKQKGSLSRQTYVASFLQVTFTTRASPPVVLDTRDEDPDDRPTVQDEKLPPLNCYLLVPSYFL